MSLPLYAIVDVKNNVVWNHRRKTWEKTVTRGATYKGVRHGRRRQHITTPGSVEFARDLLHREEANFHRELEIQSLEYMAKDVIPRGIVLVCDMRVNEA